MADAIGAIKTIEGAVFGEERALYGSHFLCLKGCAFKGEADGESALKCSSNIEVEDTWAELRYPFWHDDTLAITNCTMTEACRAALWYSVNISVRGTKLHGIKALRECRNVSMEGCDVRSPEFGWFCKDVAMKNTAVEAEYFLLRSSGVRLADCVINGKYSLQYVEDALIENCTLNTKDALWHAKNVVVRHCTINGEYLGWYSEDVVFEDCVLKGTQPLCCCKGLRIANCRMENADRAFEKSDVEADVIGRIDSIKNPASGTIKCDEAGEVIMDEAGAKGAVLDKNGKAIYNATND